MFSLDTIGGIDETALVGIAGEKGVEMNTTSIIDGFIHSHYTNLLSIFSPDDLFAMATFYIGGKINNTQTFTAGVVTASGTQYILMIDNLTKFDAFANEIKDKETFGIFSDLYESMYHIKETNTVVENETAFMLYLESNKTGLKLFKGNDAFNSWKRKKVDEDGNIVDNPCN